MDPILVVNAGSSSVKFQVFAIEGASELTLQIKGQVDGIGTQPRLRARGPGGVESVDESYERGEVPDVPAALAKAGAWLRQRYDISPVAVGHRVVHAHEHAGVEVDDADRETIVDFLDYGFADFLCTRHVNPSYFSSI